MLSKHEARKHSHYSVRPLGEGGWIPLTI